MQHTTYCRLCSMPASASCRACHLPYLQDQYTAASCSSPFPIPRRTRTTSVSSSGFRDQDSLLLSTSAPAKVDDTIHKEPPSDLENSSIASPTDSLYISFPLDPPQQTLYQKLLGIFGFGGQDQESQVAAGVLRDMKDELGREVTLDKLTISGAQQHIKELCEAGGMVAIALERRRQELRESETNPHSRSHGPRLMREIYYLIREAHRQQDNKELLENKVRQMRGDLKDKERLHRYLQKRYARARSTV
ncbi:hypothetical protein BDV06DRAFT_219211 [Aspergillus oleicola]